MRRHLLSVITVGFAFFAIVPTNATAPTLNDYMVGEVSDFAIPAGNYTSRDISVRVREPGEQSRVTDLSEKRGKVLLVTFWQPCGICNAHLNQLQDLQQKMGKDRLEVIAVYEDHSRPFESAVNALKRLGYDDITPYQALSGQLSNEMSLWTRYEIKQDYPRTWIIDPQGDIRLMSTSAVNWTQTPEIMRLIQAMASGDV